MIGSHHGSPSGPTSVNDVSAASAASTARIGSSAAISVGACGLTSGDEQRSAAIRAATAADGRRTRIWLARERGGADGRRAQRVLSKTSRWWSSSYRSKQTLLALTPEVNASRKSALVSQRGSSSSLSSVFLRLGAANRFRHWQMVSM